MSYPHPAFSLLCIGLRPFSVWETPLLPIPSMPGHLVDPVAANKQLLQASPTKAANQPFLTFVRKGQVQLVMVTMLTRVFRLMLQAWGLDTGMYSLHSLHRAGATAAYRAGADHLDVKRHGFWSSDAF